MPVIIMRKAILGSIFVSILLKVLFLLTTSYGFAHCLKTVAGYRHLITGVCRLQQVYADEFRR